MSHPVLHALSSGKMLEGCCMPLKKRSVISFFKQRCANSLERTHL